MRALKSVVLGMLALAAASPAFGQGCALCYTAADAAGSHGQKMLDLGIVVLLLPTLLLFVGVLVLLVRRARAATA